MRFSTAAVGGTGGTISFLTGTSGTATERARITSGGNFGIGTTDPDYGSFGATERILGITGVSGNRGRLSLQNTSTGTTGVTGTIAFFNGSTQLASFEVLADGATNRGYYVFNTNNGTSNTERARITSGGGLLVGTTSASGSTSNTASVVGGVFSSVSGTAAITAGTPVTLFTMPQGSAFFVTIKNSNTNADDGISTYIVQRDNSSTFLTAIKTNSGASGRLFTLQLSGTSVQGVNSAGTETAAWSAMRIS
jgi:hypothetical protein